MKIDVFRRLSEVCRLYPLIKVLFIKYDSTTGRNWMAHTTSSIFSLSERRGLNRQEAISYLGVKSTYFDNQLRPMLTAMRMGTSVVFDRQELDTIFDRLKLTTGDVGPTERGVHGWPKEPQVLPKQKTVVGESTSTMMELDFKAVLKHLKKQKTGC